MTDKTWTVSPDAGIDPEILDRAVRIDMMASIFHDAVQAAGQDSHSIMLRAPLHDFKKFAEDLSAIVQLVYDAALPTPDILVKDKPPCPSAPNFGGTPST